MNSSCNVEDDASCAYLIDGVTESACGRKSGIRVGGIIESVDAIDLTAVTSCDSSSSALYMPAGEHQLRVGVDGRPDRQIAAIAGSQHRQACQEYVRAHVHWLFACVRVVVIVPECAVGLTYVHCEDRPELTSVETFRELTIEKHVVIRSENTSAGFACI